MDLQGNHQLPEELRPFQVVDEEEESDHQGKGRNIRPDPGDVLIFFLTEEIGEGGYGKGPGAYPGNKKVNGHRPVPEIKYCSFHAKLLADSS